MSALSIERPAEVVEGFDRRFPMVFNFGHLSPGRNNPIRMLMNEERDSVGDNIKLYNALVRSLAEVVNARCDKIVDAATSGVIINTCGWVKVRHGTLLNG